MVQKHRGVIAHNWPLTQIAIQSLASFAWQRDLALFASFAAHANPSFGAVKIAEVEAHKFAHAYAATVEQLEYGAVARGMRTIKFVHCNAIDQVIRLLGS